MPNDEGKPGSKTNGKVLNISRSALDMAKMFGGVWGEHPDYPVDTWRSSVLHDATRLGYWEWVVAEMESTSRASGAISEPQPQSVARMRLLATHADQHFGSHPSVRKSCEQLRNALDTYPLDGDAVRGALIALATALDEHPRAQPLVDAIDSLLGIIS